MRRQLLLEAGEAQPPPRRDGGRPRRERRQYDSGPVSTGATLWDHLQPRLGSAAAPDPAPAAAAMANEPSSVTRSGGRDHELAPRAESEWRPERRDAAPPRRYERAQEFSAARAHPSRTQEPARSTATTEWRPESAPAQRTAPAPKASTASRSRPGKQTAKEEASTLRKGVVCYALYAAEDRYYEATIKDVAGGKVTVQFKGFEDEPDTTLDASGIVLM